MNESTAKRKRPIGVWIISIFYTISTAWSLLSSFLIYLGVRSPSPEQADVLGEFTAVDHVFTIVGSAIIIAAAITLFLLKKAAFYLFSASLGLSTVIILQALTTDWFRDLGAAGIFAAAFMWLVGLALCIYSWQLKQKGVLR